MSFRDKSLSRHALGGAMWLAAGTALTRASGLLGQFALGWLLAKEDFALYAIAISWAAVLTAIRNGGTQQLLIRRGADFGKLLPVVASVALACNLFGALVLLSISPLLARHYGEQSLVALIAVLALALPLSTYGLIYQAKLSIDLRFGTLAKLNTTSAIIRNLSAVAFALAGLGPLSFVLPLIVTALFETLAGRLLVGPTAGPRPVTRKEFSGIFHDTRWIILSAICTAVVLNGDYLTLGLVEDQSTLAFYFFGFQLSVAVSNLFTSGLSSVLMPTFVRMGDDPERQYKAFTRAVRLFALVSCLSGFALVSVADPVIHFLWKGKWDSSIIVVQLLAASLGIRLIVSIARSLLEAQGKWNLVFKMLACDALGTVAATAIGAYLGGLLQIVICVSGYRVLYGLVYCGVVARHMRRPSRELYIPVLSSFMVGALASLASLYIVSLHPFNESAAVEAVSAVVLFALFYALLSVAVTPGTVKDLRQLIGPRSLKAPG